MNFLDKFQQDQEAAKSDLTSILNQKAFDLLDSFANEAEIEVVTFSDEDENTNEAVVAGSVKKDKHGNVLSFKSIGDKNPEKQYDDSVKKDLEARKKYNSDFGKK